MSTIIKKLQDMQRSRSFIISEAEKVIFTFTCHKCRKWAHLFCFEARKNIPQVKTYLNYEKQMATHTMLMHVDNNILDKINVTGVANEFVDRKDRHKQTFRHSSQNYL